MERGGDKAQVWTRLRTFLLHHILIPLPWLIMRLTRLPLITCLDPTFLIETLAASFYTSEPSVPAPSLRSLPSLYFREVFFIQMISRRYPLTGRIWVVTCVSARIKSDGFTFALFFICAEIKMQREFRALKGRCKYDLQSLRSFSFAGEIITPFELNFLGN